jgi:hypothetical protein
MQGVLTGLSSIMSNELNAGILWLPDDRLKYIEITNKYESNLLPETIENYRICLMTINQVLNLMVLFELFLWFSCCWYFIKIGGIKNVSRCWLSDSG